MVEILRKYKFSKEEYRWGLHLWFIIYWTRNNLYREDEKWRCIENNSGEEAIHGEFFEKVEPGIRPTIRIAGMSKTFHTGFESKKVIDKMSLDFYENQITGFLGHNGAGKSTVVFILCGMYEPSGGTAYVLGEDIRSGMSSIRSSIGFCPQKSILYDELSVGQHLDLIASVN